MSRVLFFLTLIAVFLSAGSSTVAQSQLQIDWCYGNVITTSDLKINSCSAVITGGKFTGKELAAAFYNRGIAYKNKGSYDLAISDFEKAIQSDPTVAIYYFMRGSVRMRFPETPARIDDVQPDSPAATAGFMPGDVVLVIDGHPIKTFADMQRVLTISAERTLEFVVARGGVRKTLKATPSLKEITDPTGKVHRIGFLGMSTSLGADGARLYDGALADLNEAIRLNPKNADFLYHRCVFRAIAGVELQQALDDCTNAIENAAILGSMRQGTLADPHALIYLRLGDFDKAIDAYNAALALAPRSASDLYGRGLAKLRKGDSSGGKDDIGAAKAIQPRIAEEWGFYGLTVYGFKVE
jgi:tetratricopeptide (TPR) repeat protein